jgi:SAM-dependent methyltransferase
MSEPVDLSTSAYAQSFGTEAERYHRLRPTYPAGAIDFVLSGRAVSRILDLGAGTGKLTESLVGRTESVVAVEPDPAMRAKLTESLPTVEALAGSAEAIPLPDSSVDAIVVGQAFHWFPRPIADQELARVLKPGGVVGLLWNFPDRNVEWIPKIYQATREPETPWSYRYSDLDEALFTPAEKYEEDWVFEIPGEQALIELARTWSWVIAQSPAERDAIEERLRILRSQYAELQAPVFRFPQRTRVIRQYLR